MDLTTSDPGQLDTASNLGVKPASQQRSRAVRDALIECGIDLLNEMDFDDLTIPVLTGRAGCSVGNFYKRFENKEQYFLVLRDHVVQENRKNVLAMLDPKVLRDLPFDEAAGRIVDTYMTNAGGRGRGVLRSAYMKVNSDPAIWDPMRETLGIMNDNSVAGLADRVPAKTRKEAATKVKLAVQMAGSTMFNTIIEAWHPHVLSDKALAQQLKVMVRSYLLAGTA